MNIDFFQLVNNLIAAATITFRGGVGLAAGWLFFVIAGKVRWAVGTTLLAGIMAAIVIFLSWGGLELMSGTVGTTIQNQNH